MSVKEAEQYAAVVFDYPVKIIHDAAVNEDDGQLVVRVDGLRAPVFDVEVEAHAELGHVLKATPADFERWAALAEAWRAKRARVEQ